MNELEELKREFENHRHCLECGVMIQGYLRYCAPCDRKLKEIARVREIVEASKL